ncbi:galactokinase [Corynebacterium freiburgense]|uniref:galactokinase n=1 Tax=Corynebacterium freiburgense TaxID=556548 RepID=UPI0003FC7C83|nr:galactokinase [Corynebacterium freiburgense]WJZ02929.1 Galactokinase [Corynebacterium freiburgense]
MTDASTLFKDMFGYEPEGEWAAPGRVNLIGEHVDYAGGICLPFALSQRTYAAMSLRKDGRVRLVSRMPGEDIAHEFEIALAEVGPGNPANWAGYAVGSIWAAMEQGTLPTNFPGCDIALVSDVPLGAGLSSSAALECSVALGAYELFVGPADHAVRMDLIHACITAENSVVGASTGGLDQRISLMGQAGHALAIDYADDSTEQIPCDLDAVDLAILVINTNAPHSLADGQYASRRGIIDAASEGLGDTLRNIPNAEEAAVAWAAKAMPGDEELVRRRVRHVVTEIERTARAIEELKAGDFAAFGQSMIQSHASLRDDYEVTVIELDTAVDAALAAGALGARMTGGGFGGSAIALVHADKIEATKQAVLEAAEERGLATPEFLVAVPSAGAIKL